MRAVPLHRTTFICLHSDLSEEKSKKFPPVKCELALRPEEVDVVLELEFEHIILADGVTGAGGVHAVAKQRKRGKREIVLKCFVEIQTEVGEDNPKFLPAIGVLEFSQQIAGQLG